jgi:hypothetical protein
MRFGRLHFGSITINGVTYTRDVVIDRGSVGKRKKKPSRKFREKFGHTPLSNGGEAAVEVPAAHNRHGKLWIPSCNGGRQARGTAPTSRVANYSHQRGDHPARQATRGHQYHSPCHLLIRSCERADSGPEQFKRVLHAAVVSLAAFKLDGHDMVRAKVRLVHCLTA